MRAVFTFFAVFGLDWGTKYWANKKLPLNRKKEIARNRLYFWHIKNRGMAYHTFEGKRNGILLFTGALLSLYSVLFVRALNEKDSDRPMIPLAMILGGGIGNFLERLFRGSVTDFLYIHKEGRNMPIFNIADLAIMLGAIPLTILPILKNVKK